MNNTELFKWSNPAAIFKRLKKRADQIITAESERINLDIVIDYHWFFLHSITHKDNFSFKHNFGKWKYHADSFDDLFDKASLLLPYVASGRLPVVKFTNIANVFSGEKQLVVYSFKFGLSPAEVGQIVKSEISDSAYWNSSWYQIPEIS